MSGRRSRRVALGMAIGAWLVSSACLQVADDAAKRECAVTSDCDVAAGEVCEDSVCWGSSPGGAFAAVLGPPSASQAIAAATEIGMLSFGSAGWFTDGRSDGLTLAPPVRVSGRVRAPCPAHLGGCNGYVSVPAQVRWTRPSGLPGGERVTVAAVATTDGFELFLPKPDAALTYSVTIVPSTEPLAVDLPAPASYFPPQRVEVTMTPADAEAGLTRDFLLDAPVRLVTGRIARASGPSDGWRVHAEGTDGDGAQVSNLATTTTNGDFALRVPASIDVVDIVIQPPTSSSAPMPPSLHVRSHPVESNLAVIDIPPFDQLAWIPIAVRSVDDEGAPEGVAGAVIRANLDHAVAPGVFARYEAAATTTDGLGELPVYLGTGTQPLRYTLDVLPGPNLELASQYGLELVVGDRAPSPAPIVLSHRVPVAGVLLDDQGAPLAETTVSATVSTASLCQLTSDGLRVAKALTPSQDTTDDQGAFTLWLDPELAGVALRYDIAVEPSIGTWAPRWTFVDQTVATGGIALQMPPGSQVRARVHAPDQLPIPETLVSVYEVTARREDCSFADGETATAGLELRAIGVSDDHGIVRVILPRRDP